MSDEKSLLVAEDFEALAQSMMEFFKEQFERNGRLMLTALVGVRVDPKTGQKLETPALVQIVAPNLPDGDAKSGFSLAVQELISKYNGFGVITGFEAWMVRGGPGDTVQNHLKKVGRAQPGAPPETSRGPLRHRRAREVQW